MEALRLFRKLSFYLLTTILILLLSAAKAFPQEICNNGKDDDGDGLIDLQDPDCNCHLQIKGNLLQNGSFESFKNCPTNYTYTNDYNIINSWQYGTYTNGYEAEYYHNFSCSYDSAMVMNYIPPALPLPDGKAFVSIRQYVNSSTAVKETDIAKVYIGQCLAAPLVPSVDYTISFSAGRFQSNDDATFRFKNEPFTVAVFGNANCNAVPFGQAFANSSGCPANYQGWILLGKRTISGKGKWVENRINFTVPSEINVIEIGPDCSFIMPPKDLTDSTTILDFYVYYLDDIHLLPTKDFPFQYIASDIVHNCAADSVLSVPYVLNTTYQWYKDSIAIPGAVDNMLQLPTNNRNGNYNVRISNNSTCSISEPYTVAPNGLAAFTLPADTSFCDKDTLLLAPESDGITYLLNGRKYNSIKVNTGGDYTITASTMSGCSKAFNVTVHKDTCSDLSTFIPNTFTPNGDGLNDIFRVPKETKIKVKTFSIFNRWGNKVYSSSLANAGWDGRYKALDCPEGMYVYIITGTINNKPEKIKGTVLLLR